MRLTILLVIAALGAPQFACSSDETNPPTSVTQTVPGKDPTQPTTITLNGATFTFPPGALILPRDITVSVGHENPPDGAVALSPVYTCEPSGIDFAKPVTVTLPFTDDGKGPATLFWSSGETPTFTDVGGTTANDTVTSTVEHFSSGFVSHPLPGTDIDAGAPPDADAGTAADGGTAADAAQ